MSLNPGYHEQQLLAGALRRRTTRLSTRERRAETLVGALYLLVAGALVLVAPPQLDGVSVVAVGCCLVAFMAASVTEFDTDNGVAVPTQLAIVPLFFLLPLTLVPIAVPVAMALAKAPDVARGRLRPVRLLSAIGNSWFVIGPVAVFAIADLDSPRSATPLLLVGALLAQFASDFGASALREILLRGAKLRDQLGELWVYGIDAALAPIGLLAVYATDESPWSAAALLPLIGVLAVFARERRRRVEGLVELNTAYQGMALVLGDVVEHDDAYTGEHCREVVELALAAGQRLGLRPDALRNLQFAALLHDVGKVAIPKSIINKPGGLDADEWELIKTHTIEGQRMLDRVGGFMSEVGVIVRWHHERWDGSGYPDGIAAHDIPIEARIITCCDSYNAMTTDRAYRKALPADVAVRELRDCAGSQFDPAVVEAVLAVIDPGTCEPGAPAPAAHEPLPASAF